MGKDGENEEKLEIERNLYKILLKCFLYLTQFLNIQNNIHNIKKIEKKLKKN